MHDLHIWSLSSSDIALSAHVEVDDATLSETTTLLTTVKDLLAQEFGIGHATLELETEDGECAGSTCAVPPQSLGPKDPGFGAAKHKHRH
jgi:cobalt-zinc-cadmium efflux system protein